MKVIALTRGGLRDMLPTRGVNESPQEQPMLEGMAELAEVSPGHSTEEVCESRQREGVGGHQETETAYQSVQKHITRKGVAARG